MEEFLKLNDLENVQAVDIEDFLDIEESQACRALEIMQAANSFEARIALDELLEFGPYDDTRQWIRQCFNRPTTPEIAMAMLNEAIEGHGIEAVFTTDSVPVFSYVNTGDSYNPTIVKFRSRFILTTVGDMVEYVEQQGIEIARVQ